MWLQIHGQHGDRVRPRPRAAHPATRKQNSNDAPRVMQRERPHGSTSTSLVHTKARPRGTVAADGREVTVSINKTKMHSVSSSQKREWPPDESAGPGPPGLSQRIAARKRRLSRRPRLPVAFCNATVTRPAPRQEELGRPRRPVAGGEGRLSIVVDADLAHGDVGLLGQVHEESLELRGLAHLLDAIRQ